MANYFLKSYNVTLLELSYDELITSLDKYYCILPLTNIDSVQGRLTEINPRLIQKRKNLR